jgi:hypothetical protein
VIPAKAALPPDSILENSQNLHSNLQNLHGLVGSAIGKRTVLGAIGGTLWRVRDKQVA